MQKDPDPSLARRVPISVGALCGRRVLVLLARVGGVGVVGGVVRVLLEFLLVHAQRTEARGVATDDGCSTSTALASVSRFILSEKMSSSSVDSMGSSTRFMAPELLGASDATSLSGTRVSLCWRLVRANRGTYS